MATLNTLRKKAVRVAGFAFSLATLLLLANCAQNPATGRQSLALMSEPEEIQLGKKSDAEVRQQYGVYDLPALQQYVDRVGQRLAAKSHRPQLSYHFTVVDSPEINAFALPGGYIYITRGIMAYLNSEAELAAVLGHEIGHVTARHSVQQYSANMVTSIGVTLGAILVPQLRGQGAQQLFSVLNNAILSGYGREHELEADRLGAKYLAQAGYDPRAVVRVLGVLKNQELFDADVAKQEGRQPRAYHGLFATHPDNDTRLQQVVGEATLLTQPNSEEGRTPYLKQVNGMIFGDNPAQGLVRNGSFYHEALGFVLAFPSGWKIQNRPDTLLAQSPASDAQLELHMQEQPTVPPAQFLRKTLALDGSSTIEPTTEHGLSGAIIIGTKQGRPVKASAIYHKGKVFVLIGIANSAPTFKNQQAAMDSAMRSFRPFTENDRKLAKPLLVHTLAAQKGATFAELARKSPLGQYAEGYLRLLNNAYPDGEPQSGQTLKLIQD